MREESHKLLKKAERAIHAAEILLQAGDAEFAAGRAYYGRLHTAQALLREKDLRYRKHSGVHAAFGEHFAKTGILDPKFHRWLLAAFNNRIQGDYDFFSIIEEDTVTEMIEQAREFLHAAQHHIENKE